MPNGVEPVLLPRDADVVDGVCEGRRPAVDELALEVLVLEDLAELL